MGGVETKSIYICHSVYHVFISLVKTILTRDIASIVLVDTIPNIASLAQRLRASGVFCDVVTCGNGDPFLSKSYYGMFLRCSFSNKKISSLMSYVKSHKQIYIYNDLTEIAACLHRYSIKYHLIEDGFNCFKNIDQNANRHSERFIVKLLIRFFKMPTSLGVSNCCLDIEVDDSSGLKTKVTKPLRVVPRSELLSRLSNEDSSLISGIFLDDFPEGLNGGVLILTTPLADYGMDEERQSCFYRKIIARFASYRCFVKPHPRDLFNYSSIIDDSFIMDKAFPVELLSLGGRVHVAAVVSYNSTSLEAITFADVKYLTKPDLHLPGIKNINIEP